MGTTRWDAPSKRETRTDIQSLSTLKRMFGFPTDTEAAHKSESVHFAVMSLDRVGTSAFSLSVIAANMKLSKVTECIFEPKPRKFDSLILQVIIQKRD